MLQYSGTHRLAVNSIKVSAGSVNTFTLPLKVELFRIATASISGGTPASGTVSKRNVNDAGLITGVTCQTITGSPTLTSPTLLDTVFIKPDGGSAVFGAGYFVEKDWSLYVRVTDTNNVSAIPTAVSFTLDV
jgi:hypothetical protein